MAEERLQAFYEALTDAMELMWSEEDRDSIVTDIVATGHGTRSARRAILWGCLQMLVGLLADLDDLPPHPGEAH